MQFRLPPFLSSLLLAGALVAASPALLHTQIAPPGAIAWTQCMDARVRSYIDIDVLGTDSAAVILRHEEVHRRQQTDSIAKTGRCIYYVTPAQLLNAEVEAYCASDSVAVRVQVRHPLDVSAQTLSRLMMQFRYSLPRFTIADTWARGCP